MPKSFSGGCACGRLRYECSSEALFAGNCYCRDCQRASGSAFASVLAMPRAAVRLTGAPRFHEVVSDAGNPMRRGFCAECGSPVVIEEPNRPAILLLQAASLDDLSGHRPSVSIYVASAPPWAPVDPALPSYPGMPPLPDL